MKSRIRVGLVLLFLLSFFSLHIRAEAAVTMTPTWTYPDGNENWIGKVVSVGNYGSEAFSSLGTVNSKARIFSAHDQNTPVPVLERTQPNYAYEEKVASARNANIHALLHFTNPVNSGHNTPTLRRFSAQGLQWSWNFPFQVDFPPSAVAVSQNGNIIVGVVPSGINNTALATFQGQSGTPVYYNGAIDMIGNPKGALLSNDGSRLYLVSNLKTLVLNPLNGQIILDMVNWVGVTNGLAFSGDGKVFAQIEPSNKIRVYKWNGQTYTLSFSYDVAGSVVCNQLDLSSDGSFLAAACDHHNNSWLEVAIMGFDLKNGTVVLNETTVGAGQYSNSATKVAVADDASAFVVSLWGDELGQSPVLRVYTQNDRVWSLYGTFDHPGSAMDVDIYAQNGIGVVALVSKEIHANQPGGGGRLDFFTIGDGAVLKGVPHQNQTSTFEFRAPSGTVLLSSGLQATPTLVPGVGFLYLDPASLIILPPATANGQGIVKIPYTFHGAPGTSLYAQAIRLSPTRQFFSHFIKTPVY